MNTVALLLCLVTRAFVGQMPVTLLGLNEVHKVSLSHHGTG